MLLGLRGSDPRRQQQQKEKKQMLNKIVNVLGLVVVNVMLSPVILGEILFPENGIVMNSVHVVIEKLSN